MLPIPYESAFIETNGIRLHVITAGPANGRAVILLHGFPEFWYGWRHQVPALAAAGLRVIVPDQRGYNLSDVPKGIKPYALPELTRDVTGLLDHFGLAKACLAGHDWGAGVAWQLALTAPERIERLAILNVPHPAVMLDFLRRSPRQMLKSRYIAFFQIPGLPERLLARDHFAATARALLKSGRAGTFSPVDLEAYKQAWANAGGLGGMLNWYRAAARYRPALPGDVRVRVPVLMLWGKHDLALSHEMAQPSIALCERGRLVTFENATHWVQHDEAGAVNQELLAFFQP
jgi:pimeloyl-ACP methyl ester carboxylesterase